MGIVYYHCELVRGHVIAAPDDEVSKIPAGREALLAKMRVGEAHFLTAGHTETPVHSRWFTELLSIGAGTASARIDGLVIAIVRSGGRLFKILARAGAGESEARIAQLAPCRQVMRPAFALRVGAVRAAAIGAFRPAKAEPAQVLQHGVSKFGAATLRIEIFVAQDQRACILLSSPGSNPKGACVADVEQASWRRS
jgi:hypothetical protein